jgi:hypothetical protein
MPCHPHHVVRLSAAMLSTTSGLLDEASRQGAVVRREGMCGIATDNLLTGRTALSRS